MTSREPGTLFAARFVSRDIFFYVSKLFSCYWWYAIWLKHQRSRWCFSTAVYFMNNHSTVRMIKCHRTSNFLGKPHLSILKMHFCLSSLIRHSDSHLFVLTDSSGPFCKHILCFKVMKSFLSLSSTNNSGICFMAPPWTMANISLWVHSGCIQKMSSQRVQMCEDYGCKRKNLIQA